MTNFERIKSMTVEEMASFMGLKPYCTLRNGIDCIYGWHDCDCQKHAKEWLESEVEEWN